MIFGDYKIGFILVDQKEKNNEKQRQSNIFEQVFKTFVHCKNLQNKAFKKPYQQ